MELIDAIKGRRSIRQYKSDPVPREIIEDILEAGNWAQFLIPAAEALSDWHTIVLDSELLEKVRHGHRFAAEEGRTGWARAVSEQGDLVALLEVVEETGEWQPRKVFFTS